LGHFDTCAVMEIVMDFFCKQTYKIQERNLNNRGENLKNTGEPPQNPSPHFQQIGLFGLKSLARELQCTTVLGDGPGNVVRHP
jgi:hypothetical protein